MCFATTLLVGCGEPKAPILEDDSPQIKALKEAGANIHRVAIPGGMGADGGGLTVEIDLSDMTVDEDALENLNAVESVWELSLTGSHINDETIAQLGEFKMLSKLDLSGSNVTDAGLEELATKEMPGLYMLVLDGTQITGEGLVHVPAQVSGLSLVDLPIDDEDLENLEHIKQLTALTLAGTNVSAAGVKKFKEGRRNLLVMGVKLN